MDPTVPQWVKSRGLTMILTFCCLALGFKGLKILKKLIVTRGNNNQGSNYSNAQWELLSQTPLQSETEMDFGSK